MECCASILLSHTAQLGRHSCQLYMLTVLYPHGNPSYPFLLQAVWIPGLLNANRRNRSLQKFQRTLPGIEPGTARLVVQCLNQLVHACHQSVSTLTIKVPWKSISFIMTVQGLILKGLIFIMFKIIPVKWTGNSSAIPFKFSVSGKVWLIFKNCYTLIL